MSQIYSRLQTEIFQRKPYLQNYFEFYHKSKAEVLPNPTHPNSKTENSVSPIFPTYSLQKTKSGQTILYYGDKPLASIYDPGMQAERIAASISISSRDLIVVMGLGNPYLLRKINEFCPPNQILLFLDISEDLVPILWETVLEEILCIPGRHVFSGERFIPLLYNYLDGLNIERMSGLKFFRNPDSIRLAPEFYKKMEDAIRSAFSSKMSDLLTKFEFENLWIANIVSNTIRFHPNLHRKIKSLEGILKGIPGALVSAGPGLRSQIPYLREIRDKVFLMACDTALKVLLRSGILPDAVYTLDAQLNSLFHFLGEELNSIPCIADVVTSPYLLDSLNFQIVYLSMTSRYVHRVDGNLEREITSGGEFAESILGRIGDIQSGGSVATSAFEALRFMGVREFYFFGQDLAYSGREIHSTGTHHNEKWLGIVNRRTSLEHINESIIRKRETRNVESVNGKLVLTDYVLDLYKSWFEDSFSSLLQEGNYRFVNFSDKGAKIQGAENLPSETAPQILSSYREHGYPWKRIFHSNQGGVFSQSNFSSEGEERILADLNSIFQLLESLEDPDNWEKEIADWFSSRLYLKKLLHKTEVYIQRHSATLTQEKKKQLYLDTMKKEFRKLKRKLYPIMGESFVGGNSLLES